MEHKTFSLSTICAFALMCVMTTYASPSSGSNRNRLAHFRWTGGCGEPYGAPIFDKNGNLYGVTFFGGTYLKGTVYELKAGSWTEEILHSFDPSARDGESPQGTLVMDSAGNLYGVTPFGGGRKLGIVYELTPEAGGPEREYHSYLCWRFRRAFTSGWIDHRQKRKSLRHYLSGRQRYELRNIRLWNRIRTVAKSRRLDREDSVQLQRVERATDRTRLRLC